MPGLKREQEGVQQEQGKRRHYSTHHHSHKDLIFIIIIMLFELWRLHCSIWESLWGYCYYYYCERYSDYYYYYCRRKIFLCGEGKKRPTREKRLYVWI